MTQQHTTICCNISSSVEYPPTMRVGKLDEHDRPFAQYGHLGKNLLTYTNERVMFVCVFRLNSLRS